MELTTGDVLSAVATDFTSLTKKPEKFLSIQLSVGEKAKSLLKTLYDETKKQENAKSFGRGALSQLIINDFDDEQIWQQIELQNNAKCNEFVSKISHLLAKVNKIKFTAESKTEKIVEENVLTDEAEDGLGEDLEDDEMDEEESDEDLEEQVESQPPKKHFPKSVVDDQFFNFNEMENYLDNLESGKIKSSDGELIDYFEDGDDEEEKEEVRMFYSDFFNEPIEKKGLKKKIVLKNNEADSSSEREELIPPKKGEKKVKFALNNEEENSNDSEDDDSDDNNIQQLDQDIDKEAKSEFERRQERLKSRIDSLEKDALKEKPWQLQGKATATSRPQNSLLEEFVEFDLTTRPAPIITEETTLKLEDIIRQRIKDKAWDDVEKKIKPVEEPHEYKKRLILDQEKSKVSLADIYEKEFIKQRDAIVDTVHEARDEEVVEHEEIKKMMSSLFSKLDALSNFHYTPRQAAPDVKVISNVPVVTMEEVAPLATSDAMLLAPEEVKSKLKGDFMGSKERTTTDKKRERRRKKLKQHERQKAKEKISDSKQKPSALLNKVTKNMNVNVMKQDVDSKSVKSSTKFFSKLQEEVTSSIKAKCVKRKVVHPLKLSAKKIKL